MNIYQHFRKEEHKFIDQILEWCEAVKNHYNHKLTDFLDPRELEIIKQIIGHDEEIKVEFFGGMEPVERKRALIYPKFFQMNRDDFQVCLYEIQYPSKFITIQHPQVLGALMSLGLKRGKFGDILIHDHSIQIILAKEISNFVKMNLQSIHKTTVILKELSLEKMITQTEIWDEQSITVSSLRLDAILSQMYRISRQKMQQHIQNQLVKVNWKVVDDPSFLCQEGDKVSTRGYGRCKIISIDGMTKKEKWRITVGKQK